MKKYIFIFMVGIFVYMNPRPVFAQIVMTKYAKPDDQSSKTDPDYKDKSQDKEKSVKPPVTKEKPSPNGPFVTTNGSFATNLNNPKKKSSPHTFKDPTDTRHKHEDHKVDRDDHRTHNYGYLNIQNVYLPSVPVIIIPADFLSLSYNGETFYYNEGTFYQLTDRVLAPVKAPVGAIVEQIPEDYSTIQIEGDVLYIYRDIFYKKISEGFQVVDTPEALKK